MKWFRHNSDSYSNLKIQELIGEHGIEGYGVWWICCELVAQQGEKFSLKNTKNWTKYPIFLDPIMFITLLNINFYGHLFGYGKTYGRSL